MVSVFLSYSSGNYAHINDILTDSDITGAIAITKTLDKKTRKDFCAKGQDNLNVGIYSPGGHQQ
jgi:hypothetical protein